MGAREEDVEFEEELYSAGTVVVWSQGSRSQASNVYKAFTVDSPVQQVGHEKVASRKKCHSPLRSYPFQPVSYLFAGLMV